MAPPVRFLFLNQYFPPDPAPTGILFRELADALEADGHAVDFVAARQDYRAGQRKGGRLLREIWALLRMLGDSLFRKRPDVLISGTSPPCLLVVATLAAAWHRARSFHWIMDMYPEIAVALGEVPSGFLHTVLGGILRWCYRRCDGVVALDADMAAHARRHGIEPTIIRPWVAAPLLEILARAHGEPAAEWTWIYSGNLGRAHEWETLLAAQSSLEAGGADIWLLFQGGGPAWPAAQARARKLGLKHCEWRPYVEAEELPASLLRGQVLAVTQLPAVQGLLWPSKLALLLGLPRPLLWIGPTDGAIAQMLRVLPHAGIFAPGDAAPLADWLRARRHSLTSRVAPLEPAAHRTAAIEAWKGLLLAERTWRGSRSAAHGDRSVASP